MQRYRIWVISTERQELVESWLTCENDKQAKWAAEHDADCWAIELGGNVCLTQVGLANMQDYVGNRRFDNELCMETELIGAIL